MCAVYAFMRKADDLADDETLSLDQRRAAMAQWTSEWRASREKGTDVSVFVALNDAQRRFGISDELLEQLVEGTTLDLAERVPGVAQIGLDIGSGSEAFQVYERFDDLYRYCYLVASVVGLVCIRIFGYSDPAAEKLAEHVGIAFQLTNTLRDLKEDVERGRIYLPLADLTAAGVEPGEFVLAARGGAVRPELMELLRSEIKRAVIYYSDSDALVPLLDADSRAAMRVLTRIYRELLEQIALQPEEVFRRRLSVPTVKKLAILAMGMIDAARARGKK
jgi:phytoene synthase